LPLFPTAYSVSFSSYLYLDGSSATLITINRSLTSYFHHTFQSAISNTTLSCFDISYLTYNNSNNSIAAAAMSPFKRIYFFSTKPWSAGTWLRTSSPFIVLGLFFVPPTWDPAANWKNRIARWRGEEPVAYSAEGEGEGESRGSHYTDSGAVGDSGSDGSSSSSGSSSPDK
jgi:hypothetical protein